VFPSRFWNTPDPKSAGFENNRVRSGREPQDRWPVKLRGIDVGTIKENWIPRAKGLVFIETQKPLEIHRGYRIDTETLVSWRPHNYDWWWGQRAPLLPKNDTLQGTFHNGVSKRGIDMEITRYRGFFTLISSQLFMGTTSKSLVNKYVRWPNHGFCSGSIMISRTNHKIKCKDWSDWTNSSINSRLTICRSIGPDMFQHEWRSKRSERSVDKLDAISDTLLKYSRQMQKTGMPGLLDKESSLQGKINALHDAINHLKDGLLKFQIYLSD